MKKSTIWTLVIIIGVLVFYPLADSQAALVPCGIGSDVAKKCTLCHLVEGFRNLVQFFLTLLAWVSLFSLAVAGIMYIVSAGNETMMNTAKSFIQATLIGFAVTLTAWLIVNVLIVTLLPTDSALGVGANSWNDFQCL